MKCEIIRDLLPSYVDGLTSEESNREITAHVAECAPCKEILEQMQEEMQTKEEKEGRKINPFRKFNRRMMSAVAVAVAVCIGVGGFGYKAFARGFAINPQEITMEPKLEGNMLYLNFSVEKGAFASDGQAACHLCPGVVQHAPPHEFHTSGVLTQFVITVFIIAPQHCRVPRRNAFECQHKTSFQSFFISIHPQCPICTMAFATLRFFRFR